jgi:hypothetical protein
MADSETAEAWNHMRPLDMLPNPDIGPFAKEGRPAHLGSAIAWLA